MFLEEGDVLSYASRLAVVMRIQNTPWITLISGRICYQAEAAPLKRLKEVIYLHMSGSFWLSGLSSVKSPPLPGKKEGGKNKKLKRLLHCPLQCGIASATMSIQCIRRCPVHLVWHSESNPSPEHGHYCEPYESVLICRIESCDSYKCLSPWWESICRLPTLFPRIRWRRKRAQ